MLQTPRPEQYWQNEAYPAFQYGQPFTTGQSLISEYYFLFSRNMHRAIYNISYNIDLHKWGEGVKKNY